jgi:hypothetical protein
MSIFRQIIMLSAAAGGVLLGSVASAVEFAAQVISYDSGGVGGAYTDGNSALGAPDGLTGSSPYTNVLSHFSAAYNADQIVQFGATGHLTLQLSHYAEIGTGLEIGVLENAGLSDNAWPSQVTTDPVDYFGANTAKIEVSQNGQDWFYLNSGDPIDLSMPGNYYTNAGAYDPESPVSPTLADWGKPIAPMSSELDNKTYAELVTLYDGSGGGTWLDLSPVGLANGLTKVGWIRFSEPGGPDTTLEIDAVFISSTAVGAPVPEPASGLLLALGTFAAMFVGRRRPSRNQGR